MWPDEETIVGDAEPRIWTYKGIRVHYRSALDGEGTWMAEPFIDFVKKTRFLYASDASAFEWCCGPGFVGFALLAEGLCKRLCLADINPQAIECVAKTVADNGLEDRVTFYVSDNFESIPEQERFDLVVGNPPNYFALNPEHTVGKMLSEDLRPNDRGWKIHRAFYSTVGNYLNPEATLFISELQPFDKLVYTPPEPQPYDVRERPPIEDFRSMIQDGGLRFLGINHYITDSVGIEGWLLLIRKEP